MPTEQLKLSNSGCQGLSISVCLIVKNEAHHLANCLESLQSVADEIIIVDTGSTDDTLAIAQNYTDKIYHYDWHDDFAAARNYGLQYATGDWILIIDADETLPATTARLIPQYIQKHSHQPVVLNWRVVSEHQPDLYSRGLFPNHHGIYFAGRVHEIPIMPASTKDFLSVNTQHLSTLRQAQGDSFITLPSYHCRDLVIEHHDTAHNPAKSAYYQSLLEQMVNETTDLQLHNHALKHLGLSYLAQGQWQQAKDTLTDCFSQFTELSIMPEDGFYQEVLQGIKQATTRIHPPKSSRSVWPKRIAAFSLSLLAACQSSAPSTLQAQQKPILLSEVPDLRGAQKNSSTKGDFRIQSVHCPDDDGLLSACVYQSGGSVIWGDYYDYAATQPDGIYCFGDRSDPDTMCTNQYMCQDMIGCELPGDGNGDSGGGGSCDYGFELWNGQCEPLCLEGKIRDEDSGVCELPKEDNCEEDPLLLPEALTGLVQSADDLLAPGNPGFNTLALTSQQTGLPEGFKYLEAKLRQIQELNLKMETEQFKASPNHTKLRLWNEQIQLKRQEVANIKLSIAHWLSALDTQRSDFRNQLNSLKQDTTYSQDVYQGHSDPDLPQSLADYKSRVIALQDDFNTFVSNENTYDLLDAAKVMANEQELYAHLMQDYLAQKFPFGPEAPDEDPTDEDLEKQNTPKKLINFLARRIVNHSERLALQQQKTNQIVSEGLQGLGISAESYSKSNHDQLEQQLLASIEQSEQALVELEAQLASQQGFAIQAQNNQQTKALEKQIDAVKAALNEAKNVIQNSAGQSFDVIAKRANAAFNKVGIEATKIREMAQNFGPEAIEKMNQFYDTLDPAFIGCPVGISLPGFVIAYLMPVQNLETFRQNTTFMSPQKYVVQMVMLISVNLHKEIIN